MADSLQEFEDLILDDEADSPVYLKNDRYGVILVIILVLGSVLSGLFLRSRSSNQVWSFISREAGIESTYPAGWLTDEQGDFVVRISDPRAIPYKTQYILRTLPFGPQSSVRNVLDSLTIQRSNDLSAYRVLNIEEVAVEGLLLTQMDFAFVDADPNPFIQRIPVVVQGRDIVIVDNDRAIIVTFMSDQDEFLDNLPRFEQFFSTLRY